MVGNEKKTPGEQARGAGGNDAVTVAGAGAGREANTTEQLGAGRGKPSEETPGSAETATGKDPIASEDTMVGNEKKTPGEWANDLGIKRGAAGACKLRGWGRDTLVTEREFKKAVYEYRHKPVNAGGK